MILTAMVAQGLELQVDTLRVGTDVDFEVAGALQGETVYVVMGGPEGPGPCPAVAGGLCLDIAGPAR